MIVKACTRAEGDLCYDALIEQRDFAPNLYEAGSGSRGDGDAVVAAYRQVVSDLLAACREDPTDSDKLQFDARSAERIHAALPLPDEISGDDGFWRYLALDESWPLAEWRHGREDNEPPAKNHLGLGDKWWCLPRRLWLRAELSVDPTVEDPYELTRRGGSDFWMSGVIRHLYSGARPLVRALVRFQYPEPGEFVGSKYRPQTLTLTGVRELYTRLRHFNAFVGVGALDEAGAATLVESLAEDLPRAR